jgi:hypothetical protein
MPAASWMISAESLWANCGNDTRQEGVVRLWGESSGTRKQSRSPASWMVDHLHSCLVSRSRNRLLGSVGLGFRPVARLSGSNHPSASMAQRSSCVSSLLESNLTIRHPASRSFLSISCLRVTYSEWAGEALSISLKKGTRLDRY